MAAVNLKSLVGHLNDSTRRCLEAAAGLCLSQTNYNVEVEHWLEGGWRAKQEQGCEGPEDWAEKLVYPNRPVVWVSWSEADAYCRWLGEELGFGVRLPKEAEWQQAATPEKGEYPWGLEVPDAKRANFGQNVGAPTPVGIYPAGDGPYGHSDLAGNVWEWCADTDDILGSDYKVLRGGCWSDPAEDLRAASRLRYPVTVRRGFIGFRVLAAPVSL